MATRPTKLFQLVLFLCFSHIGGGHPTDQIVQFSHGSYNRLEPKREHPQKPQGRAESFIKKRYITQPLDPRRFLQLCGTRIRKLSTPLINTNVLFIRGYYYSATLSMSCVMNLPLCQCQVLWIRHSSMSCGPLAIDKNFRHGYVCAHVWLVERCLSLAVLEMLVVFNVYQGQGNEQVQFVREKDLQPNRVRSAIQN